MAAAPLFDFADRSAVGDSSLHRRRRVDSIRFGIASKREENPHRIPSHQPRYAMMPVRILHVESNADGTVGGSHRALVDLAQRVDRRRFEPVVLFYQNNPHVATLRESGIEVLLYEDERAREVEIRRHGSRARKLVDFAAAIARRNAFLRRHRIGLVHLNNSPMGGYSDWLPAARLARVPCITFAMGDAINTQAVIRWSARRFDHIIGCSRYMADAMRSLGVRDERLSWTYLGIDVAKLRAAVLRPRESTRALLGVPEDAVLAIMLGNVRQWKGQHVVLEALGRLDQEISRRVHVRFVGAASAADAEYVRSLKQTIAAQGAGDRVQLLGGRDDVPTLLAAADIAVHASVIPEPFGLVVPEALAQGLPVIASKFGGPGEVLDASCGRTFDPAQPEELSRHLAELVSDPDLRRRLGAGARARAEQHDLSIDAMVERIESVYARLLPG